MCLLTEQKEPLIAEEDMLVYKILRLDRAGKYEAPYNTFHYTLGVKYQTKLVVTPTANNQNVRVVLADTVSYKYYQQKYPSFWFIYDLFAVSEGFHGAVKQDRLKYILEEEKRKKAINFFFNKADKSKLVVCQCCIPKGSEYYKDETDLIVSNQIIILGPARNN